MPAETDLPELRAERRGSALWVVLDRPDAFNAITPRSVEALDAVLERVVADRAIRALVVTGSGKAFCAGADLKFVLASGSATSANEAASRFLRRVGQVFNRLEALPVPTIAAVNGTALAGGLELMLCCDMAIGSETARLGDAHANYGQIPGGGGTLRLPRRIGAGRAKQLMFTGQSIAAAQAVAWGLLDEACPPEALEARVVQLTEQIASKSSLVLERIKTLVQQAPELSPTEALDAELRLSDEHMNSHDRNEGLAAFTEKRSPAYLGR